MTTDLTTTCSVCARTFERDDDDGPRLCGTCICRSCCEQAAFALDLCTDCLEAEADRGDTMLCEGCGEWVDRDHYGDTRRNLCDACVEGDW